MNKMNRMITTTLVALCMLVVLFGGFPASGSSSGEYDAWYDLNNDGKIDILDVVAVTSRYATSGTPMSKGILAYDSGWIDISNMKGQDIVITPNIGNLETMAWFPVIVGKTVEAGPVHIRCLDTSGRKPDGWERTYEGPDLSGSANSIIKTNDGGYALAGSATDSGGHQGFLLIKTDENGVLQWNKLYLAPGDIQASAYSVIQTSDGGYALVGERYGLAPRDSWLIKTDENGYFQWGRSYGGAGSDGLLDLVQTSDGYALAGYTDSYGSGGGDAWLIKTDVNGVHQWNKTYGGTSGEYAEGLVQTSDGGYVMACTTTSFGAGLADFWLMKADSAGNFVKGITYGGLDNELVADFVKTSDGYALMGTTDSFGYQDGDLWLVKTDLDFNKVWDKAFGRAPHDLATALVQAADGGYALLGRTWAIDNTGYMPWIVKTDALGNCEWDRVYGDFLTNYPADLVLTSDGGYALAGQKVASAWLVKTDPFGLTDCYEYGLSFVGFTANEIILHRGEHDPYYNYVGLMIWTVKTP